MSKGYVLQMFIANRKSRFNYSSQPTHFFLCWLENIQVFCFSEKKNYFPGWHGDNFSFEILIVSFYSLFKNATAALKHEKKWQKLMNMTNPLVSYIFCPLPPFSSNLWAFWRPHLWFWTFWIQNLYLTHVDTWLNENNYHLSPIASIGEVF